MGGLPVDLYIFFLFSFCSISSVSRLSVTISTQGKLQRQLQAQGNNAIEGESGVIFEFPALDSPSHHHPRRLHHR